MKRERKIFSVDLPKRNIEPLSRRSPRDLQLSEKDVENWMAKNPRLLFRNPEAVLLIGQELAGEPMADLLAVDRQGVLIVIEVKRGSADRSTIGQLLDYAAALSNWTPSDFNERWQRNPNAKGRGLFEAFKEFARNPDFAKEDFLKSRRFFVLASEGDESMKRIIRWLHDKYNVPIDFVPFQFFGRGKRLVLEIEQIDVDLVEGPEWHGDWFFNTNERYVPGAYRKMLKEGAIAVCGYDNSEEMLNRPRPGDHIFAFLNRKGIVAVGHMGDQPAYRSGAIFRQAKNNEHNRKVTWDAVVNVDEGIKFSEVKEVGYNLPAIAALCKIKNGRTADWMAKELQKRAR